MMVVVSKVGEGGDGGDSFTHSVSYPLTRSHTAHMLGIVVVGVLYLCSEIRSLLNLPLSLSVSSVCVSVCVKVGGQGRAGSSIGSFLSKQTRLTLFYTRLSLSLSFFLSPSMTRSPSEYRNQQSGRRGPSRRRYWGLSGSLDECCSAARGCLSPSPCAPASSRW